MPNQNDPTQNPNPVNPPVDQPVGQTPPPVPSTIFPQSDLPPLPPAFQNIPETETTSSPAEPPVISDTGSSAPPDISSVIPKAKKKFGGGRIIATILGLIVLVGGVGAGIVLTQQRQLLQQKAVFVPCTGDFECASNQHCSSSGNCVFNVVTTVADGQCLGSGQTCTSGNSYTDTSCPTTHTKCGISSAPTTIADGKCLGPGDTCTSGKSYFDASCPITETKCGTKFCAELGAGLSCGPVGGPAITGATYCNQSSGNTYCCPAGQTISGTSCVAGGSTAQCTRITNPTNLNGADIQITSQVIARCTAACLDASGILYASKFTCDGINLTAGCQDKGEVVSVPTEGHYITVVAPSCGTVQYDVGCKNSANTWGNIVFSSKQAATACSTNTTTSTSSPTAPSCIGPIRAYNDTWAALTDTQLSALTTGDVVNFCVGGSTTGTFDRAQFMVNTTLESETTTPRPGSTDFCQSYTILSTDTTINVKAKIHDTTSGWVGEAI